MLVVARHLVVARIGGIEGRLWGDGPQQLSGMREAAKVTSGDCGIREHRLGGRCCKGLDSGIDRAMKAHVVKSNKGGGEQQDRCDQSTSPSLASLR